MNKYTQSQADSMIADYKSAGIGLTAPNGEQLNSFHLDRDTAEGLLSDPNVTGIQICLAKNPGTPKMEITLIFQPVKPPTATTSTALAAMTADTPSDTVPGDPPPCPTMCP